MPRIRQDNDARYALRASFVDGHGNVIEGDTIVIEPPGPGNVFGHYKWSDKETSTDDKKISINSQSDYTQATKLYVSRKTQNDFLADNIMDVYITEDSLIYIQKDKVPEAYVVVKSTGTTYVTQTDKYREYDVVYVDHGSIPLQRDDDVTVDVINGTGSANDPRITNQQITNWDTAYSWGNHATAGYLTSFTETDPTVPSHVKSITTTEKANWNTAYSWGDHGTAGYLTTFTETDPTVPSHVKSISTTNISNWNTAYGWGNHASAGYLVATTTDKSNWNTAYGWGNHAGLYHLATTASQSDINTNRASRSFRSENTATGNPTATYYAVNTFGNGNNVVGQFAVHFQDGTSYTRAYNSSWSTWRRNWSDADFTSSNVSNWNTAYSWGNHASAGYITNSGGTTTATANTVAKRDSSADLHARLFRSNYANQSSIAGGIAFRNNNSSDNYIRFCSDGAAIRSFIGAGTSSFSGNYNDLSNKPTIPTNNNQLTNGAGYITSSGSISGNAATATWADQVDVNSGQSSQNAWYDVVWHSGDTVYSSPSVEIYPAGGYLRATHFNATHGSTARTSDTIFYSSTDDYIRKTDAASFRTSLNVPTRTGGNASGTWGISITGSAGSVAWSNVTGAPTIPTNNNQLTNGAGYITSSGSCASATNATNVVFSGATKLYGYASGGRATGDFLATGDIYAYYSDQRLKDVSGPLTGALEKISTLDGVYYTHNDKARELGYRGSERQVGLLAQQVQAVLPEVIGRAPIDNDGEGGSITGENYITVKYERIVPLLVEGIKEQTTLIEGLTEELKCVRMELEELKRGV